MQPIGYVESCYREKFTTPRQSGLVPASQARLIIHPEWQPEISLADLSEFSHLWVIFQFHKNTNEAFQAKATPPRLGGKTKSLFATRSPHRPNPIGLSVVKIEEVTPDSIFVSGVDIIDGTPILDIKPYLPASDCLPEASSGWTKGLSTKPISVTFEVEPPEGLENLVRQTLGFDARPLSQKKLDQTKVFGVYLDKFNVKFRYDSDQAITVVAFDSVESDE